MYIPPPSHTHSRIFNFLERYLGMLNRGCKENYFSWEMENIEMVPKPTTRWYLILTPRKRCELAFLTGYLLKIFIWNSLWISLLMIGDHKVYNTLRIGIVILMIWSNCLTEKEKLCVSKRISGSIQYWYRLKYSCT